MRLFLYISTQRKLHLLFLHPITKNRIPQIHTLQLPPLHRIPRLHTRLRIQKSQNDLLDRSIPNHLIRFRTEKGAFFQLLLILVQMKPSQEVDDGLVRADESADDPAVVRACCLPNEVEATICRWTGEGGVQLGELAGAEFAVCTWKRMLLEKG